MHYHISTGLILQEFPKGSECPLCEIKAIVERQIVDQFLNEAVMVDQYRDKVNRLGFCAHHYDCCSRATPSWGWRYRRPPA